jgi:uncharacterized RDD family membrane protein YckC
MKEVHVPYCANCGTQEMVAQQFCSTCGAATSGPFAEPAPLPYFAADAALQPGLADLAGFWWRALGFVIDSLIVGAATELPAHIMNASFYPTVALSLIAIFFYWALFITYWNGQTLGMRVVNIRCVTIDGRGPVDLQRSMVRSAAYCVLLLIGSLYHFQTYKHPTAQQTTHAAHQALVLFALLVPHLLDLLWAAWDKNNQTLHDKVAKTIVLRPRKLL